MTTKDARDARRARAIPRDRLLVRVAAWPLRSRAALAVALVGASAAGALALGLLGARFASSALLFVAWFLAAVWGGGLAVEFRLGPIYPAGRALAAGLLAGSGFALVLGHAVLSALAAFAGGALAANAAGLLLGAIALALAWPCIARPRGAFLVAAALASVAGGALFAPRAFLAGVAIAVAVISLAFARSPEESERSTGSRSGNG